ncbi:MAG: hypothetical protein HYV33_00430 [Candidatus Kerfeldbacteria bacterium]|nr:hypothetical protein [Candidatus Kerfeldbacteria bacterium]
MSLVFAGIIPHSPVTLPHIHPTKQADITQTMGALKELEGELYVMQPDTIMIISPHAPMAEAAFAINLAPQFSGHFQEFGDITSSYQWHCDVELISKIREYIDAHGGEKVIVLSQPLLDYGATIPLVHVTGHLPKVKIVPLSICLGSIEQHFRFGQILRSVVTASNKRIALLASTDLAQADNAAAASFDYTVQKSVQQQDYQAMIALQPALIQAAEADRAQKTLAIFFGALNAVVATSKILSYQRPYGTGLLVTQFNLI